MIAAPSLPVESFIAERRHVVEWVQSARTGEQLAYARMPCLPAHSATRAMLQALEIAGIVRLNLRAAGNGLFDYIATRRAPPRSAAPRPPRRPGPAPIDGDMARVLRVLRCCARHGQPCPTNRALAKRAKLKSAADASYQLRKLIAVKRIASEIVDRVSGARIVTICATGLRTADPREARADG